MSEDHVYKEEQELTDALESARMNNAFVANANEQMAALRRQIADDKKAAARLAKEGLGLSADALNTFVNNFNSMMNTTAATMTAGLSHTTADFAANLNNLRSRMQNTDARITAADSSVTALAQAFHDVFRAVNDANGSKKARAEQIAARMEQMLADARDLHPERFAAEAADYNTLAGQLRGAKDSIANGDYDAALIVTQSSIYNATSLLVRMGLLSQQYETRLEQARVASADLTERIGCLKEPGGRLNYTMDGQRFQQEYDITYWNGEKFGAICSRHEEVVRQLKDPALTANRLAALEAELERLEADLTACDNEGRERMVASDSVWNTAEQIYDVLEERGWEAQDSGYVNDDPREPVEIVMTRGSDTISVVVTDDPKTRQPGFVLDIHTKDPVAAAAEKQGVYHQLMGDGMPIKEIKHGNTCHAPEVFRQNTIDRIRRQRKQ